MLRRLFILVLVLGVLGAGAAWWTFQQFDARYRGFTDPEVFVEIPPGSSTPEIAGRLSAMGVVRDPLLFRLAVRHAHADRHLQAGEYRFFDAASPNDIVARLRRGDTFNYNVTFPEGMTIWEMGAIFERAGLGAASEFVDAAKAASLIVDLDPGAKNLEGYLFPSTYQLPRRAGAAGFVRAMVKEFRKELGTGALPDGIGSVRELVTLASIVEKETADPAERPIVAAVYLNRLKLHMALQCDPTVVYAMMLRGRWNGNIRKEDLTIDSPYNTYRYPGLPPGPIASPGRASLDAVRRPADVKYLYFVSRNDGTHVFARTLEEHNKNVRAYQSHK
jgi:UPF0755 protein